MFEAREVAESIPSCLDGRRAAGQRRFAAAASAAPDAGTVAMPAGDARLGWVNPARASPRARPIRRALRGSTTKARPTSAASSAYKATRLAALTKLLAAAREAGHKIRINSAFRSYREQARVFRTMKERGRAARPGHSEHQLGTAIDLQIADHRGDRLARRARVRIRLALSYPPGKQRVTGYRPEPWHIRYVGDDLAAELHRPAGRWRSCSARPELGESGGCQDCPAAISRKACGKITEAGACEGTVLTWCYDGGLAAVDCAVSEQLASPPPRARPPTAVPRNRRRRGHPRVIGT